MSQHLREVCAHGQVIRQCRCPGAKDERVVRPCPFEGQPGHESAGQTLVEEVGAADRRLSEELGRYIAGVNRYARDAHFHARVKRIEQLMRIAEPEMKEHAATGALWGIVTALHLVDTGVEAAQPPAGTPNSERLSCTFRDCSWQLEVPDPTEWAAADGLAFRPATLLRLHKSSVERDIRAHLLTEHRLAIETLAGLLPGGSEA